MSDQNQTTSDGKILYCSFCGKSQHEVRKLIAGPSVYICDECVELCNDIIREELDEANLDKHEKLHPKTFTLFWKTMSLVSSTRRKYLPLLYTIITSVLSQNVQKMI